jgi:hypothetical protein
VTATPIGPVELIYEAPPECPSKQSVLERTIALMRHQPSVPITASATITRQAAGYRLELDVEGGRQRIVSESCDSLVHTAAVILALSIDLRARDSTPMPRESPGTSPNQTNFGVAPVASATLQAPSATTAPSALPTVAPPVAARMPSAVIHQQPQLAGPGPKRPKNPAAAAEAPAAPRSRPPRRGRSNPELHPVTQLLTEYGMLRHLAEGPSLGLWVDLDGWSLNTAAEWLIPEWKQMPDSDLPRGGHISFLGGQADACLALMDSRLVEACAGLELGDLMGKGSGVSNTQLGHGVWLAPVAGLGLRPRLGSTLSADLRLGMAFPVKRPAFGFEGYSWRFDSLPWSIRLMSGFSWF